MPFSDLNGITEQKWTEAFTELFVPAITEAGFGYVCERSDIRNGAFTKDIIQNLKNSHVVLADITHFNANVMWELGIRHALSKRTILIARNDVMQIISDLKIYGVIPYSTSNISEINAFKKKIKEILQKIENEPERSDSPVFDFLNVEELIRSDIVKKQIIGNLNGLLTELFYDLDFAEEVQSGKNPADMDNITLGNYRIQAMTHLLTTNYVFAHVNYYILIQTIANTLFHINRRLDLLLLDKRFVKDSGHGAEIKKESIEMIEKIKSAITQTRSLIKAIEKNQPDLSTPPVVYRKEEHKKFLD